MILSRIALAGLGLGLVLAASPCAAQPNEGQTTGTPALIPTPGPAPAPPAGTVDPDAVQALERMGAYLATMKAFELQTQTSLDLVSNEGQRLEIDGGAHYKVLRPQGFVIDVSTDMKSRRFYYDGKQLSVVAPKLGYYASTPMTGTNREVVAKMSDQYGIDLPLVDLFSWSEPNGVRAEKLTSAFMVGPATMDGVQTDQYAFRQAEADWQVWIQRGDQPLPRKVVIIDRSDPAYPAYSARLNWTVNPTLTPAAFAFQPAPGAKQIRLNILDR